MSLELSAFCSAVKPSATLAIDAKAKALRAAGRKVIGFGVGEPNFPTPDYICKAAHEAIDMGMTKYTPASGTPELKKAVCEYIHRRTGLEYTNDEVIISNGAKHSLFNIFAALINPGDEVLIPAPFWVSYPEMVRMHGGIPVYVQTKAEDNFLPQIEALESAVSEKTKAIIVNSPNNPTGCVYPKELLLKIAELAVRKGFYVVSDEIYERLIYTGEPHISIASLGEEIRKQTLIVNGLSKSYAMTGWRIGYTLGPKEIIKAMSAYQSHATSNPNAIAQHAAAVALANGEDNIREMHRVFNQRRMRMTELLEKIEGVKCSLPHGAFYILADFSALIGKTCNGKRIENAFDLSSMLLDEASVAIVPGDPFGAPDFCRLSYAVSDEDIEIGIAAIQKFVSNLT